VHVNPFTRWIITQPGVGSLKLTGPEGNCFPDMGKELELVVDIYVLARRDPVGEPPYVLRAIDDL
jgi:hypothetical protein